MHVRHLVASMIVLSAALWAGCSGGQGAVELESDGKHAGVESTCEVVCWPESPEARDTTCAGTLASPYEGAAITIDPRNEFSADEVDEGPMSWFLIFDAAGELLEVVDFPACGATRSLAQGRSLGQLQRRFPPGTYRVWVGIGHTHDEDTPSGGQWIDLDVGTEDQHHEVAFDTQVLQPIHGRLEIDQAPDELTAPYLVFVPVDVEMSLPGEPVPVADDGTFRAAIAPGHYDVLIGNGPRRQWERREARECRYPSESLLVKDVLVVPDASLALVADWSVRQKVLAPGLSPLDTNQWSRCDQPEPFMTAGAATITLDVHHALQIAWFDASAEVVLGCTNRRAVSPPAGLYSLYEWADPSLAAVAVPPLWLGDVAVNEQTGSIEVRRDRRLVWFEFESTAAPFPFVLYAHDVSTDIHRRLDVSRSQAMSSMTVRDRAGAGGALPPGIHEIWGRPASSPADAATLRGCVEVLDSPRNTKDLP